MTLAGHRGRDLEGQHDTALAIWDVLHGTVMLQEEFPEGQGPQAFRTACLDACELLAARPPQD